MNSNGDPVAYKALEAPILVEATALGHRVALQIRKAFIIRLAFIRGTQEAHGTALIDHEEVFDRVALLLAAGEFLLVLGIGRAVDRPLSTIMPKRGGVGATFVRSAASSTATSSAVRAGRSSWCAKA
jgi:hypothetical protein